MATTGDPLFDLGVLLAYWIEHSDPSDLHALRQVPSLESGAPTRADVAQAYLDAAGRPHEDLSFYFTLGRLRLAIAWQQLFVLHRRGALPDPKYAGFAGLADAVLAWTADSLDHSPI
jgi:aminoglycoside phosphotransferase (APT) family kinase protein